MTRATARALKRVVLADAGDMVLEVTDRVCTIRPKGTRAGGPAEAAVTWGALYLRTMMAKADARIREKKRLAKERKRARRSR